jgi:hypothetical protein
MPDGSIAALSQYRNCHEKQHETAEKDQDRHLNSECLAKGINARNYAAGLSLFEVP